MNDIEKVRNFLKNIDENNIKFKKHFYDKIRERPISEELIRKYLKNTSKISNVEKQKSRKEGEDKYKLWIKLSNKYNLVVVAAICKKDLYIITSWNTNRKWQKSIQK